MRRVIVEVYIIFTVWMLNLWCNIAWRMDEMGPIEFFAKYFFAKAMYWLHQSVVKPFMMGYVSVHIDEIERQLIEVKERIVA